MGMRFAAIDFQFRVNRAAEAIVRNHSAHGPFHQQFRMARSPRTQVLRLVAADKARETHVAFLVFLLSGHTHFLGVDHDDEVASIDVRREDGFLFAAQKNCSFDGNLAKDLVLGVDDPPLALDLGSFGRKRFLRSTTGVGSRKLWQKTFSSRGEKGTETTRRGSECQIEDRKVSDREARDGSRVGWHSTCLWKL